MAPPMLSTSGLPIKIMIREGSYLVVEVISETAGSRRMESTPIISNAIALTLDKPIDFAFSPLLSS